METKRKTFVIWLVVLILLIGSVSLVMLSPKQPKTPELGTPGGVAPGGGNQGGGGGQPQVPSTMGKGAIVVTAKVNLSSNDKPTEVQQVGNPPQKALVFRDVAVTVELPGTGAAPHRESMIMIMDATGSMAFIFTPDKPVTATTKANVTVTRQGYKPLEFTGLEILPSGDHMSVNLPPLTFTK